LPHSGRDLTIGHLVSCLDADYAPAESFFSKTFFQLDLCLARTKYQNGVSVSNTRNDFVIVLVEVAGESPVSLVLCGVLPCPTGIPHVLLHVRCYLSYFFFLARDDRDDRLPMVDPHTHFTPDRFHSHRLHLHNGCKRGQLSLPR
jgi:hypothetical protein